MIKNYGVFEERMHEQVYLYNKSRGPVPLNQSGFDIIKYRLDFTWYNIKYLAIF